MNSCPIPTPAPRSAANILTNSPPSTYLGNALLAAGVVFLVVIQRRVPLDGLAEFRFEAAKTSFATGMWLWLLLDALLAHGGYQKRKRAIRAIIASTLLWYVTL